MLSRKMIFRALVIAAVCGVIAGITSCSISEEERKESRTERSTNGHKTIEKTTTTIERD